MTTFLLIRHAHCDAVGKTIAGWQGEVHLSARGMLQAEELALKLGNLPIDAIYCSPLERACETAEPLSRVKGLRIEISEGLGEIRYGNWTGRSFRDLDQDPDWCRFNLFRSGIRIPGGDLIIDVQGRIVSELDRIHSEFPGITAALVSHADAIKACVAYYAGIPLDLMQRIEISPASVTTLILEKSGPRILRLNEI